MLGADRAFSTAARLNSELYHFVPIRHLSMHPLQYRVSHFWGSLHIRSSALSLRPPRLRVEGTCRLTSLRCKIACMLRSLTVVCVFGLSLGMAQQPPAAAPAPPPGGRAARPTPPARDPNTPGYVKAQELPDGENAPANKDGNFIIGPTHPAAPESTAKEGGMQGTVVEFVMQSS